MQSELLKPRIKEFLSDYNSLLEQINDDLSGIDDMDLNDKITDLDQVKIEDLECDEFLYEEYHLIINLINR